MQNIVVHRNAYELGIHNPVACVIDGISVPDGSAEQLDEPVAQTVEMIQAGIPLNRPEAAGFSELFERMGYPKQIPAGRRLVESIAKKGFPRYNYVIDACNVMSARYCSGIGLHDASSISDDIVVARATGQETIVPLFKDKPQRVREGDLTYSSGGRMLAWLGRRDVDAHEFRIVDETRALLCIVLGNERTDRGYNQAVCDGFVGLIRRVCPDVTLRFLETETLPG